MSNRSKFLIRSIVMTTLTPCFVLNQSITLRTNAQVSSSFTVKPNVYCSQSNTEVTVGDNFLNCNVAESTFVNLPNGIGGRVKIFKDGSRLATTVKLPDTALISDIGQGPLKGSKYIYTGFSSQNGEADIGLMWSDVYQAWKPYFIFKNKNQVDQGTADPQYSQVQYKNGFVPGTEVTITLEKNVNGRIRFTIKGTAKCNDPNCNNPTQTILTYIIQSNTNPNIGKLDYWKVLATIADNEAGKNYAQFNNIKIDNVNASLATPEVDKASITTSGNNVTITVDSSRY